MSLRARILALVGCFALMALVVTALGLLTIGDYNRMLANYDHASENAWRGERLNHLISNVVMESRGIYIGKNQQEVTGFAQNLNADLDEMAALLKTWDADLTPEEKKRLRPIEVNAAKFIALRHDVARLASLGDTKGAETIGTNSRAERIAFQTQVEGLVQVTRSELQATKTRAKTYSDRRAGDFLITALIGIVSMMAMSLWIVSHFITTPLKALTTAIIKTSRGEYDAPIADAEGVDEVSSVWRALAVLRERSIEAERLAAAEREAQHQKELEMRQILLD